MIKNQDLANNILEMIETVLDASHYIYNYYLEMNYKPIEMLINDMLEAIQSIHKVTKELKEEENSLNTDITCECIIDSLERIMRLYRARSPRTLMKIEYELIPLLEEMYAQFYFCACIYPDKEKIEHYIKYEKEKLYTNRYMDAALAEGKYKYELSIIVIGYNKLEYTKLCVENVLKFVPKDINYELILINHGSNDGTKEYFESVSPNKQLDILKNGGGVNAVHRIVEGKYKLWVSNDVIVTENAIENMLKCIKSDEKIEWVVPTTPNVSNLQTIPASYSNMEEMFEFARRNNISDPYKWEQRARLCDPISMTCNHWKILMKNQYFDGNIGYDFPDDRLSLVLRREGYKMILAKDAYCHHFGSITLKDEIKEYEEKQGNSEEKTSFYIEGRKKFYTQCGIDPWGVGFCWDPQLFEALECNQDKPVRILGVNCGLGSNPLKIKETLKEKKQNLKVKIYNVTNDGRYALDLKNLSDEYHEIEDYSKGLNIFREKRFDYIIWEDGIDECKDSWGYLLEGYRKILEDKGQLAIKILDSRLKKAIKNKYPKAIELKEWIIITRD